MHQTWVWNCGLSSSLLAKGAITCDTLGETFVPLTLISALLPHLTDAENLWERRLLFSAVLQAPGEQRELAIPLQQQHTKK